MSRLHCRLTNYHAKAQRRKENPVIRSFEPTVSLLLTHFASLPLRLCVSPPSCLRLKEAVSANEDGRRFADWRISSRKSNVEAVDQKRVMGIEPTTTGLGSQCSTAELHPQKTRWQRELRNGRN